MQSAPILYKLSNFESNYDENKSSILFVDDDNVVLTSLGGVLNSFGYHVTCVQESTEALKLISENEYDLVLTDLKMKDVTGVDILKAVKSEQPFTPVIILTGYATLFSAIEALQAGAHAYLIKPCNVEEIKTVVERGLELKKIKLERDTFLSKLQLKNQELNEAMVKLKERENFRETMVSIFAHDLFNPVTAVKGFLNILRMDSKGLIDDEHFQYFDIIQRNIKKIELLINSLQTFYKIDNNKYTISVHEVDLRNVVDEALKNIKVFAKEKSIIIHLEIPDFPVKIAADPFELERPFTNILYNAIKFSSPNSVIYCSIALEKKEKPPPQLIGTNNHHVVVHVKDFGMGIEEEDLSRIFDKLYRAENAKKIKGSGLGLYISKFILELHNGFITVESTPNKGSLFSVYLPLLPEGEKEIT